MDSLIIYRFTNPSVKILMEIIRELKYQLPENTFYFLDHVNYTVYLVCQKKLPRPAVKIQAKNKYIIYIFKEVIEDGLDDFIPGYKENNIFLESNCIGNKFSSIITYNPCLKFLFHTMTKKYKEKN